jgi:O-succinylbenzoic acid--CoA ligase
MDPALLTNADFWHDPAPFAAADIPDLPELRGHVLFQTSGTSGPPKWIALSKAALLTSAGAVNRHLSVTPASCWGLALPPHHVGGFGVAARAYAAGCAFRDFGRPWDAEAFATWLAENQVTHTSLVPTQVHDLVSEKIPAPSSLHAIVVGGGHLSGETGRAARALGWPVLASYGMTEAASQIATQGLESLGGIYQPAPIPLLPIWQARLSPEGKLRIAGPALFSGTLICESGTWTYHQRTSEWHETSDLAELGNSCITPLGRADSRVKVLGELVDLEAIEQELAALSEGELTPGSFAVIAIPDARAEHVLVPVFDASTDETAIHLGLTEYARKAPGFRRLRPAVMLEDFPKSPLGKPRRSEIAARIS